MPEGIQARPTKIAQGIMDPLARGARRSRTPPGPAPVCGGKGIVDGCDYRPSANRIAVGARRGNSSAQQTKIRLPLLGDGAATRTSVKSQESEYPPSHHLGCGPSPRPRCPLAGAPPAPSSARTPWRERQRGRPRGPPSCVNEGRPLARAEIGGYARKFPLSGLSRAYPRKAPRAQPLTFTRLALKRRRAPQWAPFKQEP
jgi:hypothetical protein